MKLELWNPDRGQLKNMTEAWMDQRMGGDWRDVLEPSQESYDVKAILGVPMDQEISKENETSQTVYVLMTAGDLTAQEGKGAWKNTSTEELYRDAWGTALMDAGRELLKAYMGEKMPIGNRRWVLKGPGLSGVEAGTMKELYERLQGWTIGIHINEVGVLFPEKSFGGWLELVSQADTKTTKTGCGAKEGCVPGVGCRFCSVRKRPVIDPSKGEIQLPEDVLWDDQIKEEAKVTVGTEETKNGSRPISLGVAFDIGTTTMAAMLWNLSGEERSLTPMASMAKKNPLSVYGRDVISRIHTAAGDPQRIAKMQRELVKTMNEMIGELVGNANQTLGEFTTKSHQILRLSAVGNPTMMHFLFGKDPSGLAKAPFQGEALPLEIRAEALGLTENNTDDVINTNSTKEITLVSKDALLRTLPVMGGHLGADAAAALLAARLPQEMGPALLVDVGTNGELLLTDGNSRLWGCSTAAGPAFEGGSITPGSKFIDAASDMLQQGWMDEDGYVLRPMLLNQTDIRQLQMAKSAIRTGVELLQKIAGVTNAQILLTGTFGSHIKPQSAMNIGLLPKGPSIWSLGNLAGVGASLILLSDKEWERGQLWAGQVIHVELADHPEFEGRFIENMDFR